MCLFVYTQESSSYPIGVPYDTRHIQDILYVGTPFIVILVVYGGKRLAAMTTHVTICESTITVVKSSNSRSSRTVCECSIRVFQ